MLMDAPPPSSTLGELRNGPNADRLIMGLQKMEQINRMGHDVIQITNMISYG